MTPARGVATGFRSGLGSRRSPLRGVRSVRLHDLRHTCVTLLLSLGIHPRVVMEIVGHCGLEMTMNVYGHVNPDTQRAALDHLDQELTQ